MELHHPSLVGPIYRLFKIVFLSVVMLRVGEEILPQVEEFKCLGVLFTSEGKMEQGDGQVDSALVRRGEEGADLLVSLWSYPQLCSRTLGSDRKNCGIAGTSCSNAFPPQGAGLSLKDMVRSSAIQEELGAEPLLHGNERTQMRWFGHLVRMPPW